MAHTPIHPAPRPAVTALVQARRAHGVTQYRVAAALGRTAGWLSQIEIGAREPTAEELTAIHTAISDLASGRRTRQRRKKAAK